jgi:hypothetical protein
VLTGRGTRQVREALQRIADAGLGYLSEEELLQELLQRVSDILDVDTVAILLLEGDALHARAAKGIEEEVEQGVRIPLGAGFAGRIAAERRAIAIPDVDHADILNPILREKGIRSLRRRGAVRGDRRAARPGGAGRRRGVHRRARAPADRPPDDALGGDAGQPRADPLPAAPLAAGARRDAERGVRRHGRHPGGVRERGRARLRPRPGRVRGRGPNADGVVTPTVTDRGRWRPPRGHNRGRGLPLMRELMDSVDISQTDLDSAGIALLFGLSSTLRQHQQQLRLVVADGSPIARMVRLTGLTDAVPTHPTLQAALAES